MRSFHVAVVALAGFLVSSGASPINLESRASSCTPTGNPDCLAGYSLSYYNATFESLKAAVNGTPIAASGPLKLTGWRVAAAPTGQPHSFAPPHLTPQSGNQYIRAPESSGVYNSTIISTNTTRFKFKSFYFGCSRTADFTPIPCTLNITSYNFGEPCHAKIGSVKIEYIYGNPGPTGEAPLQEVTAADLATLGVANNYVMSTTGPSGYKPRLVLDDVNIAAYSAQK